IAAVAGCPICVVAVSSRNRDADRGFSMSGIDWVDNALDLATRSDVDVVVEMIGGSEGVALDLARATLTVGKSFVTANKAM
ncbi:MAG: homoserine dehydrogenase, partial [Candidatus Puniceispirillum sp.]